MLYVEEREGLTPLGRSEKASEEMTLKGGFLFGRPRRTIKIEATL